MGLAASIKSLSAKQAIALLKQAQAGHTEYVSLKDVMDAKGNPTYEKAKCFVKVPGVEDIEWFVANPLDIHCSEDHKPRTRAPLLGVHTKSFLSDGWSPVAPEAKLKAAQEVAEPAKGGILNGLVVVELSEVGACVAAATSRLVTFGATVVKVEPPEGDVWRQKDPAVFRQLNHGKRSLVLDLDEPAGQRALVDLLAE